MKNHTLLVELIREILVRLPVRSILRFKCVCKSWFILISDPQFGISHYDLAAAASPSHRLILRSNDFYAQSIDVDQHFGGAVHFLLPPPSPPRHRSLEHSYRNQPKILGSCRGLILLYYEESDDLILWNPSLSVHKLLPDCFDFFENKIIYHRFLYGFGYDASTDDYLLVLVSMLGSLDCDYNEFHIFSFKTESWDSDYTRGLYVDMDADLRDGSLLNGALHWLVFSLDKDVPVIFALDLIQRSFSEIEIPLFDHLIMEEYELYYSLRVMGGCLSLCCSVQGSAMTEIWVMKEYNVQSSWTKSIVILTYGFSPICITKDGGILGSNIAGKLAKFNDKGELLEDLIDGEHHELYYCANLQSSTYKESLLSLPSVIWETSEDYTQ